MKLYIKEKVFSFADRFNVKYENGDDAYTAVGRVFTLGKKLDVFEAGRENAASVARIEQKLLSLTTRFGIILHDNHVTDVVRKITMFTNDYRLEGLPWHLDGDFFAHEYRLMEVDKAIMSISRQWFTWGESYELDISDDVDPLLCLSIALAVDCCLCVRRSR